MSSPYASTGKIPKNRGGSGRIWAKGLMKAVHSQRQEPKYILATSKEGIKKIMDLLS